MPTWFANLKGYRTFIVNALVAVVGVLVALGVVPASQAAGFTPEQIAQNFDAVIGGVAVLIALINTVMRLVTKTPPGAKSPDVGGAG